MGAHFRKFAAPLLACAAIAIAFPAAAATHGPPAIPAAPMSGHPFLLEPSALPHWCLQRSAILEKDLCAGPKALWRWNGHGFRSAAGRCLIQRADAFLGVGWGSCGRAAARWQLDGARIHPASDASQCLEAGHFFQIGLQAKTWQVLVRPCSFPFHTRWAMVRSGR